ncbi:hypothetical protein [Breoghania sp.]|uniref:hypothetical protein n=1 Tax=Breoghania sp. TaxID=2065378 RepID=UPI00260AB61E|nr:hypothetical protein [Breoghania sp.]MDJ0933734.1 hypothetical protein [Breoghania sp.]
MFKDVNVGIPTVDGQWDGDWRLVEYDHFTGISEWIKFATDGLSFTVRKVQHNIQDILDENAESYNDSLGSNWGDGRKVATIPLVLMEPLGVDDAIRNKDWRHMQKILNDSDFAKLRTFKGRV